MSTPVYRGGMTAFGDVARLAEAQEPQPEVNDLTADHAQVNPHLEGQTQIAAGSTAAGEVPNLSVTKVGGHGGNTSGLPSNLSTSPLGSGRSRGR